MYYAVLYYMNMRKEKQTLKYYIHTFGCQMNANDSERLAGQLATFGMEPAHSAEESDLIIVNTCAVREKSEEKMYSLLGRFESIKKKKQTLIGVVGCVAQLHSSKLWDKKPFIDFIIGPDNYWQIPHLLPFKKGETTKTYDNVYHHHFWVPVEVYSDMEYRERLNNARTLEEAEQIIEDYNRRYRKETEQEKPKNKKHWWQ